MPSLRGLDEFVCILLPIARILALTSGPLTMTEHESNLSGVSTKLVATTPTTRETRVQASVVTLMAAFSLMSYFDRTIMSIAAPGIMKEFSLSETEMGWVFTAFLMSYAAMNLPGGHLADQFGP